MYHHKMLSQNEESAYEDILLAYNAKVSSNNEESSYKSKYHHNEWLTNSHKNV